MENNPFSVARAMAMFDQWDPSLDDQGSDDDEWYGSGSSYENPYGSDGEEIDEVDTEDWVTPEGHKQIKALVRRGRQWRCARPPPLKKKMFRAFFSPFPARLFPAA